MDITLNGQSHSANDDDTVTSLVASLGHDDDAPIAVAINGEMIPRSRWNAVFIAEGDDVEIVSPMQGG